MTLTEDQILDKARDLAKIKHDHDQLLMRDKRMVADHPEMRYPEYWSGYRTVCDQYDKILVHSMYGVFPDHLFLCRAPNMEEKEFDYIRKNYKQVTLPVFIDFSNSIYKSFNDGNWNIEIPESFKEGEDNLANYIDREIGIYRSLETWMKNITIPCKLRDAMGVVAVKPNYEYRVSDNNGESEPIYIINDSEKPKPVPYYYNCKQVVTPVTEKYTVILLEEKSVVKKNNKKEKCGLIFEFYDDGNIYRVEQYDKWDAFKFDIKSREATGLDYSSVTYLMGNPIIRNESVIYESPFLYSVDNLDLVATTQSYLQATEAKCVFPFRIMVGNECDFTDNGMKCNDGALYTGMKPVGTLCPKCKGSGLKTRVSALGEMMLRPEEVGEGKIDVDKVLKYVSPDTLTSEFLIKEITRHETNARQILHLGQTEGDKVQGSSNEDTASGKWIDQKNHYAFIKPISDQIFYIYEFVINTIAKMRYPNSKDAVVVNYPISFEFNTEEDYINQITYMRDAGLPDAMIYPVIYKFLSSVYHTDQKTIGAFNLLVSSDRLLMQTAEEIELRVASGRVEEWEEYLHSSSTQLISELLREEEALFELPIEEQIRQLHDLAKEKSMTKAVDISAIDEGAINMEPGDTVTPIDIEAESKAKLKGTVGGVQGILEIQSSVASGITDYSSAITLLFEIYGFSEKTAKKLLGTPKKKLIQQQNNSFPSKQF